jgi:hypothetical protein
MFTTPGIWVKTALFAVADQVDDSPRGWGDGIEGFRPAFCLPAETVCDTELL